MLLFCAKAIMKESQFKPVWGRRRKRRKKKILAVWQLSGLVLSWCFFSATGCVFCQENTRRWMVPCYKGL